MDDATHKRVEQQLPPADKPAETDKSKDRLADDTVDLDDAMRTYEENRAEYDQQYGKRKNEAEPSDQPNPFAKRKPKDGFETEISEFAKQVSAWGEMFGKEIGKYTDRISESGKFGKGAKFGVFGAGVGKAAEYLSKPYPEDEPELEQAYTDRAEREAAMIAHGGVALGLLSGYVGFGLPWLLVPLIPLGVYLWQRNRSAFAARQAMSAFVMALLSTLGVFVGGTVVIVGLVLLAVISFITLVGIPLGLLLILLVVVVALLMAFLPLIGGLFAAYGAYRISQGHDFRYPYASRMGRRKRKPTHY
jgi:uncharacterized Tic20 family protein